MGIKRRRRVLRWLFGGAVLCASFLALLVVARNTCAELFLRTQLAAAGVDVRQLTVEEFGFHHARIAAVVERSPAVLVVEDLTIDYEFRDLLNRKVDRVALDNVQLQLDLRAEVPDASSSFHDHLARLHPSRWPLSVGQLVVRRTSASVVMPERTLRGTFDGDVRRQEDRVEGTLRFRAETTEGHIAGDLVGLSWRPDGLDAQLVITNGQLSIPTLQLGEIGGVAAIQVDAGTIRIDAGVRVGSLSVENLCITDLEVDAGLNDGRWLVYAHGVERAGVDGWTVLTLDRRLADPVAALELLLESRTSDHQWGTLSIAARSAATAPALAAAPGLAVESTNGDGRVGLVLRGASLDGIDGIDADLLFDVAARADSIVLTLPATCRAQIARVDRTTLRRIGLSADLAARFAGPMRLVIDPGLIATLERSSNLGTVAGRGQVVVDGSSFVEASGSFGLGVERTGVVRSARVDGLKAVIRDALGSAQIAGRVAATRAPTATTVAGALELRLAVPVYSADEMRVRDVEARLDVELDGPTNNFAIRLVRPGRVRIGGLGYRDYSLISPIDVAIVQGEATVGQAGSHFGYAYQMTTRIDGFAVQLDRDRSLSVSGRIGSLVVKGDGRAGGVPQELVAAGGYLTIPEFVAIDDMSATVAVPTTTASFAVTSMRDIRPTPLLAPLRVVGEMRGDGPRLQLTADGGWTLADPRRLHVRATHSSAESRGSCELSIRPWKLPEDTAAMRSVAPSLLSITATGGTVEIGATVGWTAAPGFTSSARVVLKDASFSTPELVVDGLNLSLDLVSLQPITSAPNQKLSARKVDIGAAVTELDATFGITDDAGPRVNIANAEVGFAGGKLKIANTGLSVGNSRQRIEVELQALDLSQLFQQIGVDGLSATGKVSGMIPIIIEAGAISLEHGRLEALSPGSLRYRSDRGKELLAQGGESVVLMLQALEDFRYDELAINLRRGADGETRIEVTTLGSNPTVLRGYPFRINIGLDGNTQSIVAALDRAYRLRRGLEQQWVLRMRK